MPAANTRFDQTHQTLPSSALQHEYWALSGRDSCKVTEHSHSWHLWRWLWLWIALGLGFPFQAARLFDSPPHVDDTQGAQSRWVGPRSGNRNANPNRASLGL
ncbi:hypothetical protein I7I51_07313 [Histoplasma capsulatum]|uniref:Uncharacterized protein n=1 Tax=Ajellomyces capsulatus TaxID=5037 RepID=A0A8A1MIZ4_AJECA|nr:hypothetical protein I7I51_07313 [Histoplasma capsulatum]